MSAVGRRRILFVAESVTLAHVARAHSLARALDPAEYEVHLAWDPRYNAILGTLAGAYHPIASLPGEVFLSRLSAGAPMHDVATLRSYVEEDLRVIRDTRAEIVVSDFRLSLAASARIAGVPLVTVANAYWSPYGNQSFMFPEYDYPLSDMVGPVAARALFRLFRRPGFAAHTRPLNRVLSERGLSRIGWDIRRMYTYGDLTLYADIPGLAVTDELPSAHRYVGAVLWSPTVTPPGWWQTLAVDQKWLYVTLGSSGASEALVEVLRGLADFGMPVVAATAGRAADLRQVPANAHVADFLPGEEAARRAALVICNGGSPTTYQALAAGVPVIGLVSNNMDQHLNMANVRRAGCGEVLRARDVKAADVSRVAARILSGEGYHMAARRSAEAHRTCSYTANFPEALRAVP